jgi:hypothetical protein
MHFVTVFLKPGFVALLTKTGAAGNLIYTKFENE